MPELETSRPNITALVQAFRDIRDNLTERRREFDEYERMAKDNMSKISMQLRDIADEIGVDSFKTPAGTAYRQIKESYRVGNWDSILEFMKETGNWQMLEKRVAKLATKEIHQQLGELPPGVEYNCEVEFIVRKS
jgi:phage regulator Rha-like protein